MIRHFDLLSTAPVGLLLVLILVAPLPLGSIIPLGQVLLQVLALLAFLAVLIASPQGLSGLHARVPALAVAAVGLFGVLQSLPWPRSLVAWLAPPLPSMWDQVGALLDAAPAALLPLSLVPEVSRAVGVHWLTVAACLLAAAAVGHQRQARRLVLAALLISAVFEITYGADLRFARRSTIWGIEVPGDVNRLRGTFVNPDHFAMYLGLGTTVCVAWLWWSLRRMVHEQMLERRLLYAIPPALAFAMLFSGLAFTGSRAGLVAVVAALLVQASLLGAYYRRWWAVIVAMGVLGLGFLAVLVFGLQQGLGRFLATSAYEVAWNARRFVYVDTLELWLQFPWTGTGLGTFYQAFPLVQRPELAGIWQHAHSDVLELLATTGIVGLPLIGYAFWRLVQHLWRVLRDGRRSEDRAAGLAALGALSAVGFHSLVDFGLTMPANAFTLAVLSGLACGTAVHHSPRRRH